ncbi:PilZ domain-containing protein [bacterium 1XD21-13]|nr:PilZ domain-containing protein [bacterium 1XD21-13]
MKFREILEGIEEKKGTSDSGKRPAFLSMERGGYGSRGARTAPIEGEIASEREFFWRLEDLKLVRVENDRSFFRLETNLKAQVLHMERFGAGEVPARLLNISPGGAGIGTMCQCCKGDKLLLKVGLLTGEEEWRLFCQVVRIEECGVAGFVYGCRFVELGEQEQVRLREDIARLECQLRG